MASYIGTNPPQQTGIVNRFQFTATANQTVFTGADANSVTLFYISSNPTLVFLNGVQLVVNTDYTQTDNDTITLASGATVNDEVEIMGFGSFDLNNAATTRSQLGLGTAATKDVGTSATNIPQLDGSGKVLNSVLNLGTSANNIVQLNGSAALPAVDGSNLTGINTDLVDDTTPQLGGNLDTNDKNIITVSNRDINLYPNGTGAVEVGGNTNPGTLILNCENNSHGVKIQSPAHSAGQSYTLILPTSVGTANQVLATNGNSTNQLSWIDATETKPTVTNTSQTIAPATATDITIAGTNFVSIPQVEFIKTDGSITVANSVTFTSSTSLGVNVTLAIGNYYVRVENPDGNAGRSSSNILTASTAPAFSTGAGSLGTVAFTQAGSFTVVASSDSAITYSKASGSFPSGFSLNASTGVIAGTENSGGSSETTFNFTIRATDQEGQTADRAFSITVTELNYFGDGSDGALST